MTRAARGRLLTAVSFFGSKTLSNRTVRCVARKIYVKHKFQSCLFLFVEDNRPHRTVQRSQRVATNTRPGRRWPLEHSFFTKPRSSFLHYCARYPVGTLSRTLRRAHTASDRQSRLKRTRRRAAVDGPVAGEPTDENAGPIDDGYGQALAQWRINEAVERAEGRAKTFLRQLW